MEMQKNAVRNWCWASRPQAQMPARYTTGAGHPDESRIDRPYGRLPPLPAGEGGGEGSKEGFLAFGQRQGA